VESDSADEKSFLHPSPALRSYVRVLRKIEREPGDAPMTSAAVRALERARKLRAKSLLEESRAALEESSRVAVAEVAPGPQPMLEAVKSVTDESNNHHHQDDQLTEERQSITTEVREKNTERKRGAPKTKEEQFSNRKPISEVLHDIYDTNAR
jgi:hypothetical protein